MSDASGMEEVKNYLRQLEFKRKLFGGCDKEDVLQKMHTVTMMFREQISQREEELEAVQKKMAQQEAEFEADRQKMAQRETELEDARQQIAQREAEFEADRQKMALQEAELESARQQIAQLAADSAAREATCQQLAQQISLLQSESTSSREYEEKSRVLMEELVRMERERGSILNRAETEARKIILQAEETAREQIRRQRRDSEQELEERQRELAKLTAELDSVREVRGSYMQDLKITMRLISEEVQEIREKTQDLLDRATDDEAYGAGAGNDRTDAETAEPYHEAV